ILRLPGALSDGSQRTPSRSISSAMVGVPGWDTARIWLSAGPGLGITCTCPASFIASCRATISLATSRGLIFKPSFGALAPYHSPHSTNEPRGGQNVLPSGSVASVPSASAHQPTENGCAEPQSNDLSTYQLDGTGKRGTTTRGVQTSSSAPPATMFQSPSSIARTSAELPRPSRRLA